jgi:optic atrophy 3 protein
MRLRLGLLRDTAAIEREAAKEAAEAQAKKHKHPVQTVKTEADTIAEEAAAKNKEKNAEKAKAAPPAPKPRIRPLSEAKAIDTGANFISETFLFLVGGSLIFFESWRSRRKETTHREDVSDRLGDLEEGERAVRRSLVELEREILRLKAIESKQNPRQLGRILPREVWELEEKEEKEEEKSRGWLSRVAAYLSRNKGVNVEEPQAANAVNQPSTVKGKQSDGEGASSSPAQVPGSGPTLVSAVRDRLTGRPQPPASSTKEASTTPTTK